MGTVSVTNKAPGGPKNSYVVDRGFNIVEDIVVVVREMARDGIVSYFFHEMKRVLLHFVASN